MATILMVKISRFVVRIDVYFDGEEDGDCNGFVTIHEGDERTFTGMLVCIAPLIFYAFLQAIFLLFDNWIPYLYMLAYIWVLLPSKSDWKYITEYFQILFGKKESANSANNS